MIPRSKGARPRRPIRQEDPTRVNERIRVPEIRCIDAEGNQIGVINTDVARQMARVAGLDLVEVSPTARPPVCRIMDYGKFKFEAAKKAKISKAKQHVIKLKEIKLRPKTDDNDFSYRADHAREFLAKGYKVKVTLVYRGREMAHQEFGRKVLDKMLVDLADYADVESAPRMEGNSAHVIFTPARKSLKKVVVKVENGAPRSAAEEAAAVPGTEGPEDPELQVEDGDEEFEEDGDDELDPEDPEALIAEYEPERSEERRVGKEWEG